MHGMKKGKKKALWAVGVVLGLVLLAVAGYVLYVVSVLAQAAGSPGTGGKVG